jgi:hypothetical protein
MIVCVPRWSERADVVHPGGRVADIAAVDDAIASRTGQVPTTRAPAPRAGLAVGGCSLPRFALPVEKLDLNAGTIEPKEVATGLFTVPEDVVKFVCTFIRKCAQDPD